MKLPRCRFLHMAAGAAALHSFSHRECTGLSDQTDPLDHWLSGRRRRRHGSPVSWSRGYRGS